MFWLVWQENVLDYLSIGIITMTLAALPIGLIINHLLTKRAERARVKRNAECAAEWANIRMREELRQKAREELRVRMGGTVSSKVRAQIPVPMSSERRRVADRSD